MKLKLDPLNRNGRFGHQFITRHVESCRGEESYKSSLF